MNRQRSNQDQDFAERASVELSRQSEALDAATASQLNQARQRALAEFDRPPPRHWRPALVGAAVTAALVLAVSLPRIGSNPSEYPLEVSESLGLPDVGEQLADLDLLSAETDLAMLNELDFYLWVGNQLANGGPAEALDDPLDDPFG